MADADPAEPLAMSRLMAELQQSNPQLAMLAQLMQARTIVAEPVSPDLSDEVVRLAEQLAAAEAKIDAMKRQARRLVGNYHAACDRLADLAAALGACGLCWGEDSGCPSCRGRGRPGMVRPDPEIRARLLGPPRPRAGSAEHSAAPCRPPREMNDAQSL
ncbi:MAG: hypothetical protein K2X76_02440 [Sphingomonas sp.]|nr:hypothetical protein [Sphingomonas sp.]